MPAMMEARIAGATFIVALDHALGYLLRPLANLLPHRLRRAAEKIERQRSRPIGQIAALGFLVATIFYGLVVGGQIGRLGDWLLVAIGFGIEDVKITGQQETSEIAVLEQLDLAGSLDLVRRRRCAEASSRRCPGSSASRCGNSIRARSRSRSPSGQPYRAVAARRRSPRHRPERRTDRAARRVAFRQAALHGRRRRQRNGATLSRRADDAARDRGAACTTRCSSPAAAGTCISTTA